MICHDQLQPYFVLGESEIAHYGFLVQLMRYRQSNGDVGKA